MVFSSGVAPVPDPRVTALEDKILNDLSGPDALAGRLAELQVSDASSTELFPLRPQFSNKGQPVVLWANYFKLDVKPQTFSKYVIQVSKIPKEGAGAKVKVPEAKGRKLHRIVQLALAQVGDAIPVTTEFKSQVISLKPLDLPDDMSLQVQHTDEGRDDAYVVKFHGPADMDLSQLLNFLTTMSTPLTSFPVFSDVIDAMGVVLGHNPRASDIIASIGRSRHFPLHLPSQVHTMGMPEHNSIIRGYFASTRPATGGPLLNVNVTHGVFKFSGPVSDLMGNFNLQNDNDLRQLHKTLGRVRAKVTILVDKNQPASKPAGGKSPKKKSSTTPKPPGVARIVERVLCGLATKGDGSAGSKIQPKRNGARPNEVSFVINDPTPPGFEAGKSYTVAQYFQMRYGREVNPNLPVINTGTTVKPVYVPAEFVEIIPGQAVRRKTTPEETRQMIESACRSPAANAESIVTIGRDCLGLNNNPILDHFGISVDKRLLAVNGRELTPPDILYTNTKTSKQTAKVLEGSWNMRDVKVVKAGRQIDTWTWVHIDFAGGRPFDNSVVKQSIKDWVEFMKGMGIKIPGAPTHPDGIQARLSRFLDRDISQAFQQVSPGTQFVFIVLPNKDTETYNTVKTLADTKFGFHTVCVVRQNIIKQNHQYYANVALKVNLKAGGMNHTLSNGITLVKDGKTMVVGYDVTHPTNLSGNAENLPSLVGMVSSIDPHLAQMPATAWSQASRLEMLDENLESKFKERILLWRKHNRTSLLENIIIYRDGVSEGQFQQVLDKELPQIRKACQSLYPAAQRPKISLIVSVKRHQTRFYPTDPNHMTKSRNVKPGTTVDRGVTQARIWDFYLTAHSALQGTARPAHYTVLVDEIFRSTFSKEAANMLEKITHEMCYLFGRATKAVSICPPAYYADIVCTRQRVYMADLFEASDSASIATTTVGNALSAQIHENLRDSMYYI